MKHFGDGRISENDNRLPLKSTEGNMEVNEYDTMQMNEIEVNRDNFDEGNFSGEDMSRLPSDNSLFGDTSSYSDDERFF